MSHKSIKILEFIHQGTTCKECYDNYPKNHSCGGLLHLEYDRVADFDIAFIKCDRCDYSEHRLVSAEWPLE